jgi:amidase
MVSGFCYFLGKRMEETLLKGSIAEIGDLIATRKLSIQETAAWYLSRIDRFNRSGPGLNAVRLIAPDALTAAKALDDELAKGRSRGPLHGIPILLKDNILTGCGMSTAAGSAALVDFIPRQDATLVRRLREAGAIILGKANLTEFADYVSDVMPSGFSAAGGMVKNPHSRQNYGRGLGSSVGPAAAVAASFAPVAIGSETQNSIQTPASVSSVFGFKPTVGLVSRAGVVPLVPSQDSPGPIARSMEDLILVLDAIAGADLRDTASMSVGLGHSREPLQERPLKGLRLGIPRRLIVNSADLADELQLFEAAIDELARAGVVIIDPCDIPSAEQILEVRSSVFRTEFKQALNAFLIENRSPCGIASMAELIRWNEHHPEAIPYGQPLLIAASESIGLDDRKYREDRRRDIMLSRQGGIDAALYYACADALIAPMGVAAKLTGKAGAPVLAIPIGLGSAGNPAGVTIFSSMGGDRDLLEIGAAITPVIGCRAIPEL